jgi:hypothetical protein
MSKHLQVSAAPITRRRLLGRGLLCAGAAAAAGIAATAAPAAAASGPAPGEKWSAWAERNVVRKSTQADAGYQPTHSGIECCSNCRNFIAPNRCAIVEGVCNADGLCQMHYKA